MVAPRKTKKIFCTIVRVAENGERNQSHSNRFSTRPSRLLPWADPYIAKLVRNLQDEVRSERGVEAILRTEAVLRTELDPLPATDSDGGWADDARWTPWDDTGFDSQQ